MARKRRNNHSSESVIEQASISFSENEDEPLDELALETQLWNKLRALQGTTDASEYRDFVLLLFFYKRFSDVFDGKLAIRVTEFEDEQAVREAIKADCEEALKTGGTTNCQFYIPQEYSWKAIRNHPADGSLGKFIHSAMSEVTRLNPSLQGAINIWKFNECQSEQGCILDDGKITALIEAIDSYHLEAKNKEDKILGQAFEYMLWKFAETQKHSAGELYTLKNVGELVAELINPVPNSTIYDPLCGSGSMLIKSRQLFEERYPNQTSEAPKLYGQDFNSSTLAVAKINMLLHGYTNSFLEVGDTLAEPKFTAGEKELQRFDYVLVNPPWNQDEYKSSFYRADEKKWNRFQYGIPPKSSADWGWVQHILASLKDNGRAAILLDTGALSRGSGSKSSHKEKEIRKRFIEEDLIESVILLPDNLFVNTTAAGVILFLNRNKPDERKENVLLVNASSYFIGGNAKKILNNEVIPIVTHVYENWDERSEFSKIVSFEKVRDADYNLDPSNFIKANNNFNEELLHELLEKIWAELK